MAKGDGVPDITESVSQDAESHVSDERQDAIVDGQTGSSAVQICVWERG